MILFFFFVLVEMLNKLYVKHYANVTNINKCVERFLKHVGKLTIIIDPLFSQSIDVRQK